MSAKTFQDSIFQLTLRIHELKLTARAGWNKEFPPGHRLKTRRVPEAESVADHSYSLAFRTFAVAIALGLDVERTVLMALIHDTPELITTDVITATLEPEERVKAMADKRLREEAAARALFLPYGAFGELCYKLWVEFEERSTKEAQIVWQLDKIEAAAQAVCYAKQGHQLDPIEFIVSAEEAVTHPFLLEMLADLRRQLPAVIDDISHT